MLMKRQSALMKESVVSELDVSKCTPLDARHVKIIPYRFNSLRPSRMYQGPKKSTPERVNGGDGSSLSVGRSAIFWTCSCPRNLQHFRHLI